MFDLHSSVSEMEVEFSAIILTLIFMILILTAGTIFRSNTSTSHFPPGPWKLPLIGNLHQLVGSQPHRALRELARKYGPLMQLQLGEVAAVVVSSPETAKEVMKTQDIIFASRPHTLATEIMSYNSTSIGFSPYGEYWRQLRKICVLELLSTRRVQSFRCIREEETSSLIRWLACNAGSPVNLTEKIHSSAYTTISRIAFGKKSAEQETFIYALKKSMKLSAAFNIAEIYPSMKFIHLISGVKPKLERLHGEVDKILEEIINDHRIGSNTKSDEPEAHKDLVDVLLKYHEDENVDFSLSVDNIKAVLLDMFVAGGETSATTVDWAMSEMIKNSRILKKAQDEVREVFSGKGYVDEENFNELKYLKLVIRETLRLHPPAPLLPRQNSEKCVITGYEIPLKTKLIVNAWAINTDPLFWEDAECFKPERFLDSSVDYKGTNFEYIPFGAGRRICPGMQLGLINVELPLAKFLYHFNWNLPGGMKQVELDMKEAIGITVRRKDDLYLIPVIRNPLPVQ